jgi:hypothetical protein
MPVQLLQQLDLQQLDELRHRQLLDALLSLMGYP